QVRGLYAIAAGCLDEPDVLVGARSKAPLIVGLSDNGNFLASAVPAVLDETRRVIRLHEGDIVAVGPGDVKVYDRTGAASDREVEVIGWDQPTAEKAGYPHFFLKEVYEQPEAL